MKDFLRGFGSILNLSPSTKTYEEKHASDTEAIASDWKAVGDDFRKVMGKIDNELDRDA